MPSYTRYLNPHGSLVSRNLVKLTQPTPEKLYIVDRDPFTCSLSPISLGNASLSLFIRSNYIITLRLPPFSPIAYDDPLTRVRVLRRTIRWHRLTLTVPKYSSFCGDVFYNARPLKTITIRSPIWLFYVLCQVF